MDKKNILGIFALLTVGLLFSAGMISAYRGDYSVKGPEYTEERHELMETAFENLDYDTWYSLMSESGRSSRVLEIVTRENFETFAKAHIAAENGDLETATSLRAELGLNNGNGARDGSHRNLNSGNRNGNNNQMRQNMLGSC